MKRCCRNCQSQFEIEPPNCNQQYCCAECKLESDRRKAHIRNRQNYAKICKRLHPQERTCAKCGGKFYGHGCALYCNDCLNDGTAYMNKLRDNRTTAF